MQPPLIVLPPRFILDVPAQQLELLERMCRWDQAAQVSSAMFDACRFIEENVKPEHFKEPHVHAAAFLLLAEFAYYRRGQTRKKPKCIQQVLTLLDPFRIGFYLYD